MKLYDRVYTYCRNTDQQGSKLFQLDISKIGNNAQKPLTIDVLIIQLAEAFR